MPHSPRCASAQGDAPSLRLFGICLAAATGGGSEVAAAVGELVLGRAEERLLAAPELTGAAAELQRMEAEGAG